MKWYQRKFYDQNPKYKNTIDWAIRGFFGKQHTVEDPYMLDDLSADNDIKYCPVCEYCWEKPRSGKSRKILITYNDFPKFGKEKRKCPHCTGELNFDYLCRF